MKLYYAPGTCSLAVDIALLEAGITVERLKVDLGSHRVEDGADYYLVNPHGYVPALEINDGTVLTEAAALLQYVGDRNPNAELLPVNGTQRAQTLCWLSFVATELHKGFSPWLFRPDTAASTVEFAKTKLAARFDEIDRHLSTQEFLAGKYSIADIYAFTVLGWASSVGIDLRPYPAIKDYFNRISARPKVVAALSADEAA